MVGNITQTMQDDEEKKKNWNTGKFCSIIRHCNDSGNE